MLLVILSSLKNKNWNISIEDVTMMSFVDFFFKEVGAFEISAYEVVLLLIFWTK